MEATNLPVEETSSPVGGFVSVDTAIRAKSLQRIALEIREQRITVDAWPGQTKPQATQLYAAGRAQRAVDQLTDTGWDVKADVHLTFWPNRGIDSILWCRPSLPFREYTSRLAGPDKDLFDAQPRSRFVDELWPRLVREGYAAGGTDLDRDRFLAKLKGRQSLRVVCGLGVFYGWRYEDAVEMDGEGSRELIPAVRERIQELLAALEEPPLPE
jgi:hypothetical protein